MPMFSSFSISGSLGLQLLGLIEGGTDKEGLPPQVSLQGARRKDITSFLTKMKFSVPVTLFNFISKFLVFSFLTGMEDGS